MTNRHPGIIRRKCEASQERDTFGVTGDEGLNLLWQQGHEKQALGLDVCWPLVHEHRIALTYRDPSIARRTFPFAFWGSYLESIRAALKPISRMVSECNGDLATFKMVQRQWRVC